MVFAAAGEVVTISPSVVKNRWQGRWLTYPVQNHLVELPLDARTRALTDLVEAHVGGAKDDPPHYRAWCLRQYGRYLTETFYDEFTAKYWRVGGEELATDWLGGRLLPSMLPRVIRGALGAATESQAVFAQFRYPVRGGFFGFFGPLYSGLDVCLRQRAVEVDARRQVVTFASGRVEPYDFLASSVPLPELIGMIKDVPAPLRQAAALLRATQLLCVNLVVGLPRLTDCHWFYVYDRDVEAARVSVPSNLSPGMLPAGRTALQAEVFRRDDEPLDADALVERTAGQLGEILGFGLSEVLHLGHVHVRRAYVLSDHHRGPAVAALRAWLEERNILPMGLYGRWKYVWSDEAFAQGRETALAILAWQDRRQAG
jgi:protoporphyrinogen oxidase